MNGTEYNIPVSEFMDLIDAAEAAVTKMFHEYYVLQPDAVIGECWAEAERLQGALETLRQRMTTSTSGKGSTLLP